MAYSPVSAIAIRKLCLDVRSDHDDAVQLAGGRNADACNRMHSPATKQLYGDLTTSSPSISSEIIEHQTTTLSSPSDYIVGCDFCCCVLVLIKTCYLKL